MNHFLVITIMNVEERNAVWNIDCREGLKKLPNDCIDCVVTSPPYWSLRDYGVEGSVWGGSVECEHEFDFEHIQKEERHAQVGNTLNNVSKKDYKHGFCLKCNAWKGCLGLEPTFELYVEHLADIFDGMKRVLKPSGLLFLNLGDTYDNKNLLQIPFRVSIEMQSRGWILRNVIIWHKSNCMPSSARDRFTVDFEPVFMFSKGLRYWFDQDAVREKTEDTSGWSKWSKKNNLGIGGKKYIGTELQQDTKYIERNPSGRNKRTVWTIPTKPNSAAHFATFNEDLITPMIKSGCPKEVCSVCGKARERIVKNGKITASGGSNDGLRAENKNGVMRFRNDNHKMFAHEKITTGWTDCGHESFKPGIVLDPFAGTGTTCLTAWELGRDYLGFEVNKEYVDTIVSKVLNKTKNKRLDEFF